MQKITGKKITIDRLARMIAKYSLRQDKNFERIDRRFEKIEAIMVTKDDIKNMATKDDIRNMVVKDDIKNMVVKDDIKNMVVKGDIKNMATKDDLKELENRLGKKIDNMSYHFEQKTTKIEEKLYKVKNVIENNLKTKLVW